VVVVKHPAKYSKALMPLLEEAVKGRHRVLDPMAGTGRIHSLPNFTVGVEIEPEWATLDSRTLVGNALHLPFGDGSFDAVVTSPTYGNRFADHHNAKDGSFRRSYTHDLGRTLHPDNSGTLHWGEPYREFHRLAWREVKRVLEPEGIFVLNCKDHIRKKEVQKVCRWHRDFLVDELLFVLDDLLLVPLPGMRYGENGEARVDHEEIMIFRKGK
jgi:tRNA G10  N-methylase Trm11